jgi:hypothetical protein
VRRTRVYIAGPMSQGDRIKNLAQALTLFRELFKAGYAPLCPQLTFFADPFIQAEHHEWLNVDLPWVEVADAIYRLPGPSLGADMEVEHAKVRKIPVYYHPTILENVLPPTRN